MHIFFSGIGGTGIGPLALIAKQAGYDVSGSDKQNSAYVEYLQKKGITIHVGQTHESLATVHRQQPIDWLVYSSALPLENPNHPELLFCKETGIKASKRDELLNYIIEEKNLKLIAIAGTHGKTTTTAMAVWLFKKLQIPVSYSVGAKLSFGDMGEYDVASDYFVYEADEFDRNFLTFKPHISIISGIDYDHPDIYPTREDYYQAFVDFLGHSGKVFAHPDDLEKIGMAGDPESININQLTLAGEVNRKNAQLVVEALVEVSNKNPEQLISFVNQFPGLSRRFEPIIHNVYSDYAHTPEKIRGALQMAHEKAGGNVVVVYEGLHNTRQHFIREELLHLFDSVKKLYIVPSYLAREDELLELLEPHDLVKLTSRPENAIATDKNSTLKQAIIEHQKAGDLVLCLTAGGGDSLDEWLRKELQQ